MEKRFMAAFQSLIGRVHFFAMFLSARYSNLNIASSLGNEPRFLVTFLSDIFSDSMALVVKKNEGSGLRNSRQGCESCVV